MATPISGGTAFDSVAAQVTTAQSQRTARAEAPANQLSQSESAGYTVKLSDYAEVRLLKTEGQTVSQISAITNLSAQAVDGYLGITRSPPATASASNK